MAGASACDWVGSDWEALCVDFGGCRLVASASRWQIREAGRGFYARKVISRRVFLIKLRLGGKFTRISICLVSLLECGRGNGECRCYNTSQYPSIRLPEELIAKIIRDEISGLRYDSLY